MLVIFSDIDGLYNSNPNINKEAKLIREVHEITSEIEAMAGDPTSKLGTGGMKTKIEAAKIAVRAGCECIITKGHVNNPLQKLMDGKQEFTHFASKTNPLKARKQWIVSGVKPMGEIEIDAGAVTALSKGNSLLPAGAVKISGRFSNHHSRFEAAEFIFTVCNSSHPVFISSAGANQLVVGRIHGYINPVYRFC